MTLAEIYLQSREGLNNHERRSNRSLWHRAARATLRELGLTDDPKGAFPVTRRRAQKVKTKFGLIAMEQDVRTVPYWPRWHLASEAELFEIYRMTRPVKTTKQDQ